MDLVSFAVRFVPVCCSTSVLGVCRFLKEGTRRRKANLKPSASCCCLRSKSSRRRSQTHFLPCHHHQYLLCTCSLQRRNSPDRKLTGINFKRQKATPKPPQGGLLPAPGVQLGAMEAPAAKAPASRNGYEQTSTPRRKADTQRDRAQSELFTLPK